MTISRSGEFVEYVANMVDYWVEHYPEDAREAAEGVAFSILVGLDGEAMAVPGYHVYPVGDENSSEIPLDIAGSLHDELISKIRERNT